MIILYVLPRANHYTTNYNIGIKNFKFFKLNWCNNTQLDSMFYICNNELNYIFNYLKYYICITLILVTQF